ncbi:dinitrogenase iron-molybdenum cofactor biosynthesis protein [Quatrionicoccus australiensis]|uniref:dinitrogenase iron-molybdenum cofactor biosynthesis protein n=1 Tax=Quatrionicoccus australiensis TaxID=138118 RepID=UPI001CFC245A|nr:dinitrogenase iron-molybdenum cofactor biosynthesis protein [Quatrionicoccus australiensis]MCB4358386.1 dinitrogenase iron-molybdenum cofactor biosynthesis protein [Quatrionicoccus australiensis]
MDQRTMPITQEAALRVALASRAMPNVTLPRLIALLQSHLGEQIDTDNLRAITVTNLKTGLGSMDGEEDDEDMGIGIDAMKLAVRILWGEVQDDENLPQAEPYADGDIPDSLRVAIASDSGNELNGHFGSCLRYLVYQVSATESRLIGVRSALEADFAEDKNLFRCQLIGDCHVLYVVSIGGPAAAKVIRADIFPIKLPNGGPALEVIGRFQQALADSPPPWLAKILGVSADKRLRLYNAEEEDD